MLVAEIRQRLTDKVGQLAAAGDQEEIAMVLEYVRAVLITLAQLPDDMEFALQDAAVDTKTAALILRLHPEHVRFLIRQEKMPAVKESGEYRIALTDIADFMVSGRSLQSTLTISMEGPLIGAKGFTLWERPDEGLESEEREA